MQYVSAKKYKTRYDWVRKVIYWELCKKLKFDHTNKWHMHNLESVSENETHYVLWDFEIQTDPLISARRPDLVMVNTPPENLPNSGLCRSSSDHRVKLKESKKRNKYLDLAREHKKTMGHKNDGDTNCNWCARYSHRRIDKGTVGVGNKKTSGDHRNNNMVEIGQNTEKNCGVLLSLRLQRKIIN